MPTIRSDVSICLDAASLLWVPLRIPGVPEGLKVRPLRRLDTGTLRSAIVEIPAGWDSGGPRRTACRLQIYTLSGSLQLGSRTIGRETYLNYGAECDLPRLGSPQGAELLLVCDGPLALAALPAGATPSDALIIENVPTEFGRKHDNPGAMGGWTLYEDPETGATTRFLSVPPGWESPGPEYHPCQEEIYCLSGDIAPDDVRKLKPGWFLWNPAYGLHGFNLHSAAGGTVLEWHDGPWERLSPGSD